MFSHKHLYLKFALSFSLTAVANCLINYFSWSPAGAIRSGRNPATYRSHGETLHIDGKLSMIKRSGESD